MRYVPTPGSHFFNGQLLQQAWWKSSTASQDWQILRCILIHQVVLHLAWADMFRPCLQLCSPFLKSFVLAASLGIYASGGCRWGPLWHHCHDLQARRYSAGNASLHLDAAAYWTEVCVLVCSWTQSFSPSQELSERGIAGFQKGTRV